MTWIGPGGKGDGAGAAVGDGFLDFAATVVEAGAGFLDAFEGDA